MPILYKNEYLIKKSKGKSILHIGATDYPYHAIKYKNNTLLHQKIIPIAKKVIGVDNDRKSIDYLKSKGLSNIYFGDIINNNYSKEIFSTKYDLILFSDVIEHLDSPGLALKNIKQFMTKKTTLLLTTPNVWSYNYIFNHFRKKEFNHPDHCMWFSEGTLTKLVTNCGYKIISINYGKWGSPENYSHWYGKLFKKIVLDKIPYIAPVIIMELKLV